MLTSLDSETTDRALDMWQSVSRYTNKHTTPQISRILRQHIVTAIRDLAEDMVMDKIHECAVTKIELANWDP
jgi:hypothetical protein